MSACGYKLVFLGIIVTLLSWKTVVTAQDEKPKPDPHYPLNTTYEPRLGDNVNLTIHALGSPKFHWTHNGKKINSKDSLDKKESEVFLKNITVDDFGQYLLEMNNSKGYCEVIYSLLAEGPPQPVSKLTVSDIGTSSVQINFITGYNYNDTQIFRILRYNDDLSSCNDTTSGQGGEQFMCSVKNLVEDTLYNITVISRNSRGDSNQSSALTFTTYGAPKPDPAINDTDTFKPRIQDEVNMTIHAVGYPHPNYTWWHNGTHLNSSDTNYTSTVTIRILDAKDFGKYMLNMTNEVGSFIKMYEVEACGPPDAVSNLYVSDITQTSANITFTSGYDYNDTQTFVVQNYTNGNATELASVKGATHDDGGTTVKIYLKELQPVSKYNITVVARNSRGQSKPVDAFWYFETLGAPKPDPAINDTDTFKPRIQDEVNMTIHAVGYPPPNYTWWHNGTHLNSSDTNYTSTVTIRILDAKDFGKYMLNMTNEVGSFIKMYEVEACGPPDAVSNLYVSDITQTSANITFTSGYDYNDTQTFVVQNYTNGNATELASVKGATHDDGGTTVKIYLKELQPVSKYNITVVARNSRGQSKPVDAFWYFETLGVPMPDPAINDTDTFKPRIQDEVNMTIHAVGYPPPNYTWWHNGTHLNSSDTNYTSTVTIKISDAKVFGKYMLQMTNEVGSFIKIYEVEAYGPPDAVSNLYVSDITQTSANITFTSGYDYNDTQTFVVQNYTNGNATELASVKGATHDDGGTTVKIYLKELQPVSKYNITVVARNSRGQSKPVDAFWYFETLGVPMPDPAINDTDTFKPRIQDEVNMTIHAVGYPPPNYTWWHNGTHLNSSDTNYTSTVTIKISDAKVFGKYMLQMTNEVGSFIKIYEVEAYGPPDAVSNLYVSDITQTSANITFTSGYDYNDTQTFVVQNYTNGNATELASVKGATHDDGGTTVKIYLKELQPVSKYNITVVARNSRGQSKPVDAFWYFETLGVPMPDPAINDTDTFKPRIQDEVNMTIHAVGYPPPNYTWWHNGTHLNSSDTNYTSTVTIKISDAKVFGKYMLQMTNEVGSFIKIYEVEAYGPPDAVSNLYVSDITQTSANITFTSGYDYNDTQTFVVQNYTNGNATELASVKGATHDDGGTTVKIYLKELQPVSKYNITVVARNSRGQSKPVDAFWYFETLGVPMPDPAINDTDTFKPRIQDEVNMTIHAVGYPPPNYTWWHNGTHLNSSDTNYTSTVTIKISDAKVFGKYMLQMTNEVGSFIKIYEVEAYGPPDAVSNLYVSDITQTSANITFTSGYDYNDTQTFVVQNYTNGNATELASVKGATHDDGGTTVKIYLKELQPVSKYNITVVARNSRGQSKPVDAFWYFETLGVPMPDPAINDTDTFKPRIQDEVNMTIHAVGYPPPNYTWWHNGTHLNSSDTNYTSTVTIRILDAKDFGKYMLNMTNEVGSFIKMYEVEACGPPDAVSNLYVSDITQTSANITFTSGYDYNDTQTFVVQNYTNGNATELASVKGATHDDGGTTVKIYLKELQPVSKYNITVVARNSRGQSKPVDAFWYFETLGVPMPDPAINDTDTFKPRIQDEVNMTIHAVGYPPPNYTWWHNGTHLNSSDTNYTSTVTIKISDAKVFGKYMLQMTNEVGSFIKIYEVEAYGPPDPVSDLVAGEVTSDSVQLYWRPGFNYGSNQTFSIYQAGNDKELQGKIQDTTKGNFSMNETYKLTGLSSSTTYTVNVMANNEHGKAIQYSNSVNFTTSDSDNGGTTAEIVGYVVGGIGFVVLILVIISLIRCYKARRGHNYKNLEDQSQDGDF